jgi:hypothetical protein
MRDKAFVEGEQVVPSDEALRTYRHAFHAGTVGVVVAPNEDTAPNQVRVEILDADAVAALDHRFVGSSRTLNWHQNWWTKASDQPTTLRRGAPKTSDPPTTLRG